MVVSQACSRDDVASGQREDRVAGATKSGEEVQTGRTNRGEGRTILWADVPPGQPNFNGPAILIVEVAKDAEDPDDYENGDRFTPANQIHGLMATGWSSGSASNFGGTPGAAGVIGRGGRNEGTGVVGLGGGTPEPGSGGFGGIGVHGLGGPQADFFADPAAPPGAGLVGQGGRQSPTGNTLRRPHAAGVIGIGGGTGPKLDALPAHTLTETGGIGVYGQGAEATVTMVPPSDETGTIPGPNVPSGPRVPGAGMLGRGGVPVPPRGPAAAGVIGLAGGAPIPDIAETGDTGVYGAGTTGVFGHGPTGVRGRSDSGAGVHGVADRGRGGIFGSVHSAQVQLAPQETRAPFPAPTSATPMAFPGDREGVKLPKDGRGGDLIALMDDQRQCALWFCVRGADGGPARWAQVLLGPAFEGRD